MQNLQSITMSSFSLVSWTGSSGKAITLIHNYLPPGVQRFRRFSQCPWKASQSKSRTSLTTTTTKPTGQPSFPTKQSQRSPCNNAHSEQIKYAQWQKEPVRRKSGNTCTSQRSATLPTSSIFQTSKQTLHCRISL